MDCGPRRPMRVSGRAILHTLCSGRQGQVRGLWRHLLCGVSDCVWQATMHHGVQACGRGNVLRRLPRSVTRRKACSVRELCAGAWVGWNRLVGARSRVLSWPEQAQPVVSSPLINRCTLASPFLAKKKSKQAGSWGCVSPLPSLLTVRDDTVTVH
jgi:hypothetical protein